MKYPIRIREEEALLRRLRAQHPKFELLQSSIELKKAGYRGEKNADYYLSFLPKGKFTLLKGLTLTNEYSFQIDKLLLSPNVFFPIEVKNIKGTVHYDQSSLQFIQRYENVEKGLGNPIQQVERQAAQLKTWLAKRKFPDVPIEPLATISQSSTIITSDDKTIFRKLFHAEHLVKRLLEIEKKYPTPSMDDKTLKKIIRALTKTPPIQKNILETWDIPKSDVLTGVICPHCGARPMLRFKKSWYCKSCKNFSKNAHLQAIEDYLLIFGNQITNRECQDFLHIDSRRTSEYALKSAGLTLHGKNRGSYYTKLW